VSAVGSRVVGGGGGGGGKLIPPREGIKEGTKERGRAWGGEGV